MKKLSESRWTDIQKRSSGEEIRIEDDIEQLDRDGMYDYIYSIYDPNPDVNAMPLKSETPGSSQYFSLPAFVFVTALYRIAAHYTDGKIDGIIIFANAVECADFNDELTSRYKIVLRNNGAREVWSKDGTVSNRLLLDVIDLISTKSKKPALIKKENS